MEYAIKNKSKKIKYLVEKINHLDITSSIEEKINLCAEIYENRKEIILDDLFFLEECHQTILNWIWKQRKKYLVENIDFNQLIDLLFNVIIIFEFLPINIETLINFHFIRKLKVFEKLIKNYNSALSFRINDLVNYFEIQVKNYEKNNKMLNKKRKRIIIELSDNESIISENESIDTTYTFNSKKKIKNVSWKENLVEIKLIDTLEEPIKKLN
jgi:hypothetical protein